MQFQIRKYLRIHVGCGHPGPPDATPDAGQTPTAADVEDGDFRGDALGEKVQKQPRRVPHLVALEGRLVLELQLPQLRVGRFEDGDPEGFASVRVLTVFVHTDSSFSACAGGPVGVDDFAFNIHHMGRSSQPHPPIPDRGHQPRQIVHSRFPFTRVVAELPPSVPFVPPEALERLNGRPLQVRVGANESAFGISPKARAAMEQAVSAIAWYNDPEAYDLRAAIAGLHGVDASEVSVGAGIDELLGLVVRLCIEPGDPVVSCTGSYPTFHYHVSGFGGSLHQVPYVDDREDVDGLLGLACQVDAHLVYLANPDNPMGTWNSGEGVQRLIGGLPEGCLLILDEAYVDFAPAEARLATEGVEAGAIRMRTFSKAHGMAGARVGYAVADAELVQALDKVRNHFAVNRIAQAGALASLQDCAFVADVVAKVDAGRAEYEELGRELGLPTLPSGTNFVAFDLETGDRARAAMAALLERDVFVRMPGVPPQDRCIRVTVGTPAERVRFASVFRDVLATLRPFQPPV